MINNMSPILDEARFIEKHVPRLLRNARGNAARKKLAFDLSELHLLMLWRAGAGRCAVSHHSFGEQMFETSFVRRPFAPSLDRKDPNIGYVQGNVRLVCTVVNFALNDWGPGPLREVIASWLRARPGDLVEAAVAIWQREMTVRIEEAEEASRRMEGLARARQQRRIAGLRAALTKGRHGLREAARKARATLATARAEKLASPEGAAIDPA